MSLWVQESHKNKNENYIFGKSDVYETCHDTIGNLFRAMQAEFGRCTGKVYIGDGDHIGWVFESRDKYTDSSDTYIREVWVAIHNAEPVNTTKFFFHKMGG